MKSKTQKKSKFQKIDKVNLLNLMGLSVKKFFLLVTQMYYIFVLPMEKKIRLPPRTEGCMYVHVCMYVCKGVHMYVCMYFIYVCM